MLGLFQVQDPFSWYFIWSIANIGRPNFSGVSFSKYQGLNLLIAFLVALVECKESHWQTTFTIHVQEQFLHHVLRSPRRCFGDRCQSQWSPAAKKKLDFCCGTFPGLPRKILNNTDLLTNIVRVPRFGSSIFFHQTKPCSSGPVRFRWMSQTQKRSCSTVSIRMVLYLEPLKNPKIELDVWCNNHFPNQENWNHLIETISFE